MDVMINCMKHVGKNKCSKYDYSKVAYINYVTKVEVICHKHGSFWITPNNHENGGNCPKCMNEAKIKDIIGFRSGKLVVTKFAYTKNRKAYWYAQCDCGSPQKIYPEQALTRPEMTTKSCGDCGYKEDILRECSQNEEYRNLMREITTRRYMK